MAQRWFGLPVDWYPIMGVPLARPPEDFWLGSAYEPRLGNKIRTAGQIQVGAAVRVLNRVHTLVPDLGYDPELSRDLGVAELALLEALDLSS